MGLLEHAEIETICPNVQLIQTSQQALSKDFSGFNENVIKGIGIPMIVMMIMSIL